MTKSDAAGLDVSQMLLREPALLTADLKVATRCLLELRIKLPGSQDVSRILMQQPSLLLADFSTLKCVLAARVGLIHTTVDRKSL